MLPQNLRPQHHLLLNMGGAWAGDMLMNSDELGCCADRHSLLGFCMECPGGALLTVVEWCLVICLWLSVQSLSKAYPTLELLLLYAQCLSVIQGFNVPWPQVARPLALPAGPRLACPCRAPCLTLIVHVVCWQNLYELTTVMSIVNFNIDAVTPVYLVCVCS